MSKIKKFPEEIFDQIKYYVYRLIDPRNGETFYVGKGKGNRIFSHIEIAKYDEKLDELNDKLSTIREIHLAGLEVIHVIHRHGMDENTAYEVEAALIDAYPNATNIMSGSHSNNYGPMHAQEIITKYAADEVEFQHRVIMINVNRSKIKINLYDAVRAAWRLSKKKAAHAEYVLAVSSGLIIGVFKPNEWLSATNENFPFLEHDISDRFGFVGDEASEDVKKLYLHKRIPDSYRKKGSANPIRYNY